jgi:Plant transposon protein
LGFASLSWAPHERKNEALISISSSASLFVLHIAVGLFLRTYLPETVYVGKEGKALLVLEAVADHNLFFWHAAFGFPGTHNDINILDQSPLWKSMLDGSFHHDVDFHFWINGQQFVNLFLLADGIYPSSGRFCKTFTQPIREEKKKYAMWQEAARKDIEHAFGVLQRKFQIMKKPIEQWYVEDICDMMYTCIILHNWMVSDHVSRNEEENEDLYGSGPRIANQSTR